MSHDIDDLLDLIKKLELRIIELEKTKVSVTATVGDDSWYWNHG